MDRSIIFMTSGMKANPIILSNRAILSVKSNINTIGSVKKLKIGSFPTNFFLLELFLTKRQLLNNAIKLLGKIMQTDTLISFLLATALVTLIPGPNILLIVNDSIQHGIKNGLYAVIGVTIGMIPLFSLSLAGVSTLLVKWTWLFDLIKISGVIYLVYLGYAMIMSAFKS